MKKGHDKEKKSKGTCSKGGEHIDDSPKEPISLKEIFGLPEFWSFVVGLGASVMVACMILGGLWEDSSIGHSLMKILTTHLVMGAPMGALEGAKFPFLDLWLNITYNCLITTAIICFFNTLFSLSCKRFFHIPILHNAFKDIQSDAKRQKKTWARFGIPGIFAFVFIPMPMTGPVVGSLLARFVGLRYWGVILTVIVASVTSICAWGYAADVLEQYLGRGVLTAILWGIILLTVLIAAMAKIQRWEKSRREKRQEAQKTQEEDDRDFYDAVHDDANKN